MTIIEPTCALCTANMRHFLSVCLSIRLAGLDQNSDWTIIHILEIIEVREVDTRRILEKYWSTTLLKEFF